MDIPEDDEIRSQLSSAGSFQEPLQPPADENVPLSSPAESDMARRRQILQQNRREEPYPESSVDLKASVPISMPMPSAAYLNPSSGGNNENVPPRQPSLRRKPVGSASSANNTQLPYPVDRPPSPQKVLGPRPMLPPRSDSNSATGQLRPLARSPGKENVRLQPWSEDEQQRPYEDRDPLKKKDGGHVNVGVGGLTGEFDRLSPYSSSQYQVMEAASPGVRSGNGSKGISVTLIRRDPGSGDQWNVGRLEVSSGSSRDSRRQSVGGAVSNEDGVGVGVLVEITNEGYNKFMVDQHQVSRREQSNDTVDAANSGLPFRRWFNLGPPKSPTSSALTPEGPGGSSSRRNGFRSSLDFSSSSQRSSMQQPQAQPSNHLSPYSSNFNSSPNSPTSTNNQKEQQQAPYTFLTPWSTPCAFTTGLAGKSLKCRHLPYTSSPSSDPSSAPSLTSSNRIRSRSTKEEGSQVSELRFNLPATAFLSKPKAAEAKKPQLLSSVSATAAVNRARERASLQMGSAGGLPPRPVSHQGGMGQGQGYGYGYGSRHARAKSDEPSTLSYYPGYQDYGHNADPIADEEQEDDDEVGIFEEHQAMEDERLDLSRGQERAGGGFSGKKAKLGKLIVENEGLAMLDLVVAANMGVWWWIGAAREK